MLSAFRKEKHNISLHSHIKKFQAGPDLAAKSASGKGTATATLIPDVSHAAAMRRNRLNELAAPLADVPVCIPGWGNMLFNSGHGEPAEEQSRTKKKKQKGKVVESAVAASFGGEPAAAPSGGGPAAAPSGGVPAAAPSGGGPAAAPAPFGDVPAPTATKVRILDKRYLRTVRGTWRAVSSPPCRWVADTSWRSC